MPPEYTAKFSLQLLLDVCGFIEAVFFTDHFNDARTALQVRLVADHTLGNKLFASYCRESLVCELLARADTLSFVQPNDVLSSAAPALEALVQIDAVFGLSCHGTVESLALEFAEEILSALPLTVNIDEVKLPRPPIYASTTDAAVDNSEIVAWNKIHYFVNLFTTSLKLTNRLSCFVQFVVGALLKYNPSHTELNIGISPTQMFGSNDTWANENEFFRLLLLVLQMNARDLYTLSKISPEFEGKGNRRAYAYLVDSDRHDPETVFQTWMGVADRNATDQIVEFLAYMKNDGANEERYLPAFTEKTRKTWQSHFFTEKKANSATEEVAVCYEGFSKFPIDVNTHKKLAFLNSNWKRFAKSEGELISVFLGLTPEEFTEVVEPPNHHPTIATDENPLQKFIKTFLLEGNHESERTEKKTSKLTSEHFSTNPRRATKKKRLKEDHHDLSVEDIRQRLSNETEFMKSVLSERSATVGFRMQKCASRMHNEVQQRDHLAHIYEFQNNRDLAIESAFIADQIRERLDDDMQKLEDGLRDIQEVIRESEEKAESDVKQRSFRSVSSTVVSIPLGVPRSAEASVKPSPPDNVFRLDLTQLSPPPSVTGNFFVKNDYPYLDSEDSAPLSTIEVPVDHDGQSGSQSERSGRRSEHSAARSSSARSVRQLEKPSWLQLIPWYEKKPSSVRILEMPKEEPLARISTTARSSPDTEVTPRRTHFDSGFIETTEERTVVVTAQRRKFEYVSGMSQNEINSVVQLIKNN